MLYIKTPCKLWNGQVIRKFSLYLLSLLLIPFSSYCSILTTVSFPFELHTIFLSNSSILAQNLKILSRHHFHLPLTLLHRATTTTTTTLFSLRTFSCFRSSNPWNPIFTSPLPPPLSSHQATSAIRIPFQTASHLSHLWNHITTPSPSHCISQTPAIEFIIACTICALLVCFVN